MRFLCRRVTIKVMQNYCARCDEAVYFAEAIQAFGSFYHKKCFVCTRDNCGRSLDSRTCNEHEGKPYCTYCYKIMFGPKGVGYGVGAGLLSINNATDEMTRQIQEDKSLPFTTTISYGVDEEMVRRSSFEGTTYQNGSIQQQFYQPIRGVAYIQNERIDPPVVRTVIKQDAPIPLVRAPVAAPQPMICQRCEKTVYEAEKILAAGSVWHKTCFVCTECNKRLESRTQCEQGGRLYCNSCYARQFGPRGYGHGVGAGILQLHQ
ncbi:unnamed protein product, partial [Mesorhabditis belari]|uniref:Cysteine-rich protein 1 n=1 Tax=Mesorhabditis belari TaxID=2138241 RepID=A0AAF3EC86_9BILA